MLCLKDLCLRPLKRKSGRKGLPSKVGQFARFDRQNHRLGANLLFPRFLPLFFCQGAKGSFPRKLAILLAKFLSANLLPLSPLSQVSGRFYFSQHFCLRQGARSIKRQPLLNFRQRKDGNIATILVVADGHFWCPRKRHPQSKRDRRWSDQAYVHWLEATQKWSCFPIQPLNITEPIARWV